MSSQRESRSLASELLEGCLIAARVGAEYVRMRTADLHALDWRSKSRSDFVSEVDTGTEERVTDALLTAFPEGRILGEELSPLEAVDSDGLTFIVDPLDGTTNFLHGYPQYAVSIAAVVNGELSAGVVLQIPHDVAYTATRGGGAYRGSTPIRVSTIEEPTRALIGTGFPFKSQEQLAPFIPQFSRIAMQTAGIRRAGSAALDLADVACGRFEAFWELMLAPWDMAAGLLLVREAGGRVTDLAGNELAPSHSGLVASNGVMHDWIMQQLSS